MRCQQTRVELLSGTRRLKRDPPKTRVDLRRFLRDNDLIPCPDDDLSQHRFVRMLRLALRAEYLIPPWPQDRCWSFLR